MAKNGTEFSKYAQAFHEVLDGKKTNIDIFTKDLLKMGLTDNDKAYIDSVFPIFKDDNDVRHITGNKGDQLRKYYGGTNGLSKLIPELETEFDSEFQQRYCEELQDFEESRIIEFAQVLKLDVNEEDIYIVSKAIAEYYSSFIKRATTKKRTGAKASKDGSKSDECQSVNSYTFSESEKKNLLQLCKLIKENLGVLKTLTNQIRQKQYEANNLIDSEKDKRWKAYLECDVDSLKKRFKKSYDELEIRCADIVKLLEPKKRIYKRFSTIISIAQNLCSDAYNISSPDKLDYEKFSFMISGFNDCYDHIIHDIDKL